MRIHDRRHRGLVPFFAALTVFTVLATACGDDDGGSAQEPADSTGTATGGTVVDGAAAMVPQDVKDRGVLLIGTDFPYAPMEFYADDGTTEIGVDVELGQAIGEKLGLGVEFVDTDWDGLIPALKSERYDMIMASMGDFTDRQEQVDFVDYLIIGEGVVVPAGNPDGIAATEDLCGLTISVAKGTVAVKVAEDVTAECDEKGLAALNVQQFPGDADGLLAVKSDRVDAHVIDLPTAAYEAATAGGGTTYEVVLPNVSGAIPYGIAFRKDDTDLRDAVQAALNEMIADGTYIAVLGGWKLEGGAVETATVNGGTTSAS
jgi:polar amino acid transport system substrate-binding protein